jgi:hypothetical protein
VQLQTRHGFRGLAAYLVVTALAVGFAVLLVRAIAANHSGSRDRLANAALTPAVLGPGWRVDVVSGRTPGWPWAQDGVCPAYVAADYPAQRHRQTARDETYVDASGDRVRQVIEQFEPGWAERSVGDVRHVLRVCGSYPGPAGAVVFQAIAVPAGPDSLLVRATIGEGADQSPATYFVVARSGSLVTTVQLPGPLGEPFARRVATAARARLAGG